MTKSKFRKQVIEWKLRFFPGTIEIKLLKHFHSSRNKEGGYCQFSPDDFFWGSESNKRWKGDLLQAFKNLYDVAWIRSCGKYNSGSDVVDLLSNKFEFSPKGIEIINTEKQIKLAWIGIGISIFVALGSMFISIRGIVMDSKSDKVWQQQQIDLLQQIAEK